MDSLASPQLLALVVTGVIAISVLIGLSARVRAPTIQAFFWANSSISPLLSPIVILCSSYSLNGILYQVWLGYSTGWISLVTQFFWSCGFIFLAINFEKFSPFLNVGTMHGIIGVQFNQATQRTAAIASVIGFSLLIGWEVSVGVSLFNGLIGGGIWFSVLLSYMLVFASILYTTQSGLRGNVRVNTINNGLKTIGLLTPLCAIVFLVPQSRAAILSWSSYKLSTSDTSASVQSLTIIGLIVNLCFSFCWQMVDMSVWQNLAATRAAARKGISVLVASALLAFLFPGVVGTVMGVALTSTPELTSDNIIFAFYEKSVAASALGVCFLVACGCAILTTIDGYSLAVGQAFTWDIWGGSEARKLIADGADRESTAADWLIVQRGRAVVLVSTLVGTSVVIGLIHGFAKSVFDVVYFVIIAQMSLVPLMLACVTRKGGEWALRSRGAASIGAGLVVGFACAIGGLIASFDSLYTVSPLLGAAAAALLLYSKAG